MTLPPDINEALERLSRAPVLLVASDFDGTLAPLADHPDKVVPDEDALGALRELASLESTHGAVISGRARQDLIQRCSSCGDIMLIGSHGAEIDGATALTPVEASGLELLREGAARLEAEFPGLFVEHKPTGVAVHYRHVDAEIHDEVRDRIEMMASCATCAVLQPGILVHEVLVVRTNKGTALAHARRRVGAAGTIFIGDDRTDEHAFAALEGQDVGVKIGEGETAAAYRVPDQSLVAPLLRTLLDLRRTYIQGRRVVPINRHSVISDQRTVALVEPGGRICWMCVPRIDSSPVFASLLGGERAGYFEIVPEGEGPDGPAEQTYDGDTFILRTRRGTFEITDYLDCGGGRPYQRAGRTDLIRVISGTGRAVVRFAPRLDFGRIATHVRVRDGGVEVLGSVDPIVLRSPGLTWEITQDENHHTATAVADLSAGPIVLELRAGAASLRESTVPEIARREASADVWRKWAGTLRLPALQAELVKRSALVIKSLCYGPSGAISAAATTSLPEQLGGVRNWDYRYCWIRDAAWSASALVQLGSTGHAMKLMDWLLGVLDDIEGPERLRPLYTVSGHDLGQEAEISELSGYGDSRPVRVGNAANQQVQLDVFGTVADVVATLAEVGAPLSPEHMRLLDAMVQAVARRWHEPDHGIWEVRGLPRHHVPSKVMCWHTIDRAIAARMIVEGEPRESDLALRTQIHADIIANGFSPALGGFSVAYGSDEPDAACLLAGLTGLLPPDDPRILGTVSAVERLLRVGPTVYRYRCEDGLPGVEGGFNICTGWLIESYAMVGRTAEALDLFKEYCALAGPTGLLAEEHDPRHDRPLGNFPQCYSHLALINAAVRLSRLNVL